jgi:hypothetical protein
VQRPAAGREKPDDRGEVAGVAHQGEIANLPFQYGCQVGLVPVESLVGRPLHDLWKAAAQDTDEQLLTVEPPCGAWRADMTSP